MDADLQTPGAGKLGNEAHPAIPESASSILSTLHGRQRRMERGISRAAFCAAIENGQKTRSFNNSWKFTYEAGGIAVVTNEDCTREITSWALPCWGIGIEKVLITEDMMRQHKEAVESSSIHALWNSHVVAVIDQSGSMRKTDATNGATRSDLVWLCLAVEYIGKRLRTGEATCRDYFSLIELGSEGKCLIKQHPMNWILYNKVIDMLWNYHPTGPGNYLPAIDTAQEMLLSNKKGNCLLQLIFLTDGAPSDKTPRGFMTPLEYHQEVVRNKIATIARQLGSRLTVGAFAVGDGHYDVLQRMIDTADQYNCLTYLKRPTLCIEDLSSAFVAMSALITASKTRVTDVISNRQRTYRNLIREPKDLINTFSPRDKEWIKYKNKRGKKSCVTRSYFDKKSYQWVNPKHVFNHPSAVGIAVRDHIFGEGKERAVRRVREINQSGEFVGPPLVGKESLFVEDTKDSISFHKTFCKVQKLSQDMARRFNQCLLKLPDVDRHTTPTIKFLDCYVMLLYTKDSGNFEGGLLVEKMLDHTKYKKWNSNDGYIDGMTDKEHLKMKTELSAGNSNVYLKRGNNVHEDCSFTIEDIPQAFSHFTYLFSERKFLVCDLQGVLNTEVKPPVFELTDPAIHYSEVTERADYGRTDRGEQGIQDFLKTHKCSNLCRMMLRRWIPDPFDEDVIHLEDIHVSGESGLKRPLSANNDSQSRKDKKRVHFML